MQAPTIIYTQTNLRGSLVASWRGCDSADSLCERALTGAQRHLFAMSPAPCRPIVGGNTRLSSSPGRRRAIPGHKSPDDELKPTPAAATDSAKSYNVVRYSTL